MTEREELIEKVGRRLFGSTVDSMGRARELARLALDLFEQSPNGYQSYGTPHTPAASTDEERELIEELRRCARDSASGSHASNSPLLRGADLATRAADALARCPVQGEPDDATVSAVATAIRQATSGGVWSWEDAARAALRAAGKVKR